MRSQPGRRRAILIWALKSLILLAFATIVGRLRSAAPPTPIDDKLQCDDTNVKDREDEIIPETRRFHLCTTREPTLPTGDNNKGLVIGYRCAGPEYETFGHNLKNLLNNSRSTYWGQRRFPLPANTSVLFMGNSHMAQVTHELICQYAPAVEKFTVPDTGLYGYHSIVEFSNGAKIFHASNSPIVYSRTWTSHLTTVFGQELSEFSLFVLGSFHHSRPSVVNTTFGHAMLNHSADYTNNFDFLTANPPALADVLKCYSGPVIAMSMFASYEDAKPQVYRDVLVSRFANRSNVRIVDSRFYVNELGECGNRNRKRIRSKPGSCDNSQPNHMHRCTGHYGGHPDLIAWDVIEAINELLVS